MIGLHHFNVDDLKLQLQLRKVFEPHLRLDGKAITVGGQARGAAQPPQVGALARECGRRRRVRHARAQDVLYVNGPAPAAAPTAEPTAAEPTAEPTAEPMGSTPAAPA